MAVLGLDIGGANIKAADEAGQALSQPFAIWNHRDQLKDRLVAIFLSFPQTQQIALTMTAELADCFVTKHEGVGWILDATENAFREAFPARSIDRAIRVWSTDGKFIGPRDARDFSRKVAAANWHALATWAGRLAPAGASLLIDIGTTTTDIIPLMNGDPVPAGLTDVARLQSGELVYAGVWRTPLCAVAHSVPFRDGYCALAAEIFATTLDIHLLLDRIPENPQNFETANGKPATKVAAHDRVARMLCCDRHEVSLEEATNIAKFLDDVIRQRLAGSLDRVVHRLPDPCKTILVSGSGSFLARQLIHDNRLTTRGQAIALKDRYSADIADAACAYALAQLASERPV